MYAVAGVVAVALKGGMAVVELVWKCAEHTPWSFDFLFILCLGCIISDRTLTLSRSSNLRRNFVDRRKSWHVHSSYLELWLDDGDAEIGTPDLLSQAHTSPLSFISLSLIFPFSIDVRKPLIRRYESRTYDLSYRCEKFRL
jgi:hypothetical protein